MLIQKEDWTKKVVQVSNNITDSDSNVNSNIPDFFFIQIKLGVSRLRFWTQVVSCLLLIIRVQSRVPPVPGLHQVELRARILKHRLAKPRLVDGWNML